MEYLSGKKKRGLNVERTKFGEFVLSYRKKNGEPQRVLASILGTSMGYLCLVERGIYDIPFRWLDLAEAIGTHTTALFQAETGKHQGSH